MSLGLTIKQLALTVWAYIWEGLLLEGFLRLTFGGLIFGRTYLFFFGGGGVGIIIGILRYVSMKWTVNDRSQLHSMLCSKKAKHLPSNFDHNKKYKQQQLVPSHYNDRTS